MAPSRSDFHGAAAQATAKAMSSTQQSKRKVGDETESSRKSPKTNDSSGDTPQAQSSATAAEHDRADAESSAMDLTTMTAAERENIYEGMFRNRVEVLQHLEFPPEVSEYPQFAHEIKAAYLRHTTFTVKVWMNYDSIAERFYYDDRAQDCGLLRLPPKLMKGRLAKYEYNKVRFELRTPFRPLARVTVPVVPTELDLGVRVAPMKRGLIFKDALLQQGVQVAIENIRDEFESEGQQGLNLDDLVSLAKYFCIVPSREFYTPTGWLRDTDVWMNFQRANEHNTGYVYDVD